MKNNECYLTEYLQKKLKREDKNVISNLETFRYHINECNIYEGKLKNYDEIGPILVKLLKNDSDSELDNLTYERILRISKQVGEGIKLFKETVQCFPEDSETYNAKIQALQDNFSDSIREFELLIAILNSDIDGINKAFKCNKILKEKKQNVIPDEVKIDNVIYKRKVFEYAKR